MDISLRCITALAMILFPQLTTRAAGNTDMCNCLKVSLEDRLSCGSPGIDFAECKARGCCYDARFSTKPFCYVNAIKEKKIVVAYQGKLEGDGGKKLVDMEEFCKKCETGIIGGFLHALFDTKPKDCNKCKKKMKIFKRGTE